MSVRCPASNVTSRASGPHNPDACALSIKWAFQLMLDLNGYRHLFQPHGLNDDELAHELGLGRLVDSCQYSPPLALRELEQERKAFDSAYPAPDFPTQLRSNLTALGELLELDETELKILGLCALLHTDPIFQSATNQLGAMGYQSMLKVISTLTGTSLKVLHSCFSPENRLCRTGLIEINTQSVSSGFMHAAHLSNRLTFTSTDLLNQLRYHDGLPVDLFRHTFRLSRSARLCIEDYVHIQKPLALAITYLEKALAKGQTGVNVLIYGPPGTGKTELARLLAREVDTRLYEVACTDSCGDPINAYQRLCALRTATSVLGQRRALLLLDEIEDLFIEQRPPFSSQHPVHKSWINQMLEENSVPCFWLTNSISQLDPAYIRRYDLIIELSAPPRTQRERIVRADSHDRLSDALIQRLAEHKNMTPAVIERAYRVASSLELRDGEYLDQAVEVLVGATLKAQGHPALAHNAGYSLLDFYSPALVNADVSVDRLLEGLRLHPEARLCFYGPPGTGKTALGQWLAQELKKPLLVRRVSDIVSPYVGMTEQNLAHVFEQAHADEAILFLDEVDSFLQDRHKARHSWEITAVNEMLMQMEAYQGLFIASTNLMGDLDEAALRRFDLKVHFGYLKQEQVESLFNKHLKALGLEDSDQTAVLCLRHQPFLTPGDFATVLRQARFSPLATAEDLARALLAEVKHKRHLPQHPIGFVH